MAKKGKGASGKGAPSFGQLRPSGHLAAKPFMHHSGKGMGSGKKGC